MATAERLRAAVERANITWQGARIPVTISLGVASFDDGQWPRPEDLLAAADHRLYLAKNGGRNRVISTDKA